MAGLDPLIAREGLRAAREVVSGRQISYPVPYILVVLAVFAIGCFTLTIFVPDPVRLVVLAVGCAAFLVIALILFYALGFRNDLLRSEQHEQRLRMFEIIGDKETPIDVRAGAMQMLLGDDEPKVRRRRSQEDDDDG